MATSVIECNCSSVGALGKVLLESSGDGSVPRTFTGSSKRVEFLYEKLGSVRDLQHTDAITGTTSKLITGVREKSYLVNGVLALQASPANLALFLPFMAGGAAGAEGTGTGLDVDADGKDRNYPLASVLPSFDLLIYKNASIHQFTNLVVAQWMLRGKTSNGGEGSDFIELILVLIGQQEIITQFGEASPWPASEPALPVTIAYTPYTFPEVKFFLNTVRLAHESLTIQVNNKIAVKFYDEIYPTCLRSTGRDVTINVKGPHTCSAFAKALAMNTTTGTAEVRMTTPKIVLFHTSFEIPFARTVFKTPHIENKDDIPLDISVQAYAGVGNDEITITNDSAV